jgi:uncharacterized protein DUF2760
MPDLVPPPFFARLWLALVCFFRIIFVPEFAARVAQVRQPLPGRAPAPPLPAPRHDGTLHLLALLQREGRLIDFCEEDVSGFADADIGAAARTVHAGCRKVIRDTLDLAPIRTEPEGAQIQVAAGFDPGSVRLTGNVIGQPPFSGTLRHHGWRATQVRFPPPPAGQDATVLAPAEVELP